MRVWIVSSVTLLLSVTGGFAQAEDSVQDSSVLHLMETELEPAAEIIWDSAGWILTEEGETELWPTTDEGWAEVAAGAAYIVAVGDTLATPDYSGALEDWIAFSEAMQWAATDAQRAAETRDKSGLFDAGGELYQTCLACHRRYMINSR